MLVKIINHDSEDYLKMIDLRINVLLEPIGMNRDYINKEKEKNDILIGAFVDSELEGCCILTQHDLEIVQLRQMAVATNLQGRHIGQSLVSFAEEKALDKGYKILMLHARNPVIPFYHKCGYQVAGEEFFEVGIGHHRMEKRIGKV